MVNASGSPATLVRNPAHGWAPKSGQTSWLNDEDEQVDVAEDTLRRNQSCSSNVDFALRSSDSEARSLSHGTTTGDPSCRSLRNIDSDPAASD